MSLGEVCLPVETIQPADFPDTEFTYFDIGGIDNVTNRIASIKTVSGRNAPSRARQAVRKNDILFSTVRTYLRKIARVERDYPNPVASTGFAVIRPAQGVSSEFLLFQMLSEEFLQPLHALQTGSSYPAVRGRDVYAQPILLAPTREQEKIAAKLNAAFSALQRAEAASTRAHARLRRYRTAVLNAASIGQLTRAWREAQQDSIEGATETGDALSKRLLTIRRDRWEKSKLRHLRTVGQAPRDDTWKTRYRAPVEPDRMDLTELPKSWVWASIDQLSWDSGYGTSVKCSHEGKGPAVLRIPNIRDRALDLRDLKFATSPGSATKLQFVAPGDLLLIRTNGSLDLIGRAAVVKTKQSKKYSFASYLIRFRLVGDQTLWAWLSLAWDSGFVRAQIEAKAATTAGQYNVSLSSLSGIAIPLPPQAEQSEIVRQVESRLSATNRLEMTLNQQDARSRVMRQSILREAFAGRLFDQDQNDEDASMLLERIRAARRSEAQKPKGRRMPKAKSEARGVGRRSLLSILRENGKPMTPEELFHASGHSQDSVDDFFAELRELTAVPAQVVEERRGGGRIFLRALP